MLLRMVASDWHWDFHFLEFVITKCLYIIAPNSPRYSMEYGILLSYII